jgi:predicted RNase H-like HicB family nuclease
MKYLVVIEPTKSGFSAYSPDLPGCVSVGRTRKQCERNMRKAIAFHIDGLREEGELVPKPPESANQQALSKENEHFPFIFAAFIAGGALAGLCIGMLVLRARVERGHLPFPWSLYCIGIGSFSSFLVGAFFWATANSFPKGIVVLRFLTILLVSCVSGAGLGWIYSASSSWGPDEASRGETAMLSSAKVGAIVGLFVAIVDVLFARSLKKKMGR